MCSGKCEIPTSWHNTSSIAVADKATQTALLSPVVFLNSPHSPAAVPSPKKKTQTNKNKTSLYFLLQQEEIKTTKSGNNAGDCCADLCLSGLKYRSEKDTFALPVIWKNERRQWSQTSSPTPRPFTIIHRLDPPQINVLIMFLSDTAFGCFALSADVS